LRSFSACSSGRGGGGSVAQAASASALAARQQELVEDAQHLLIALHAHLVGLLGLAGGALVRRGSGRLRELALASPQHRQIAGIECSCALERQTDHARVEAQVAVAGGDLVEAHVQRDACKQPQTLVEQSLPLVGVGPRVAGAHQHLLGLEAQLVGRREEARTLLRERGADRVAALVALGVERDQRRHQLLGEREAGQCAHHVGEGESCQRVPHRLLGQRPGHAVPAVVVHDGQEGERLQCAHQQLMQLPEALLLDARRLFVGPCSTLKGEHTCRQLAAVHAVTWLLLLLLLLRLRWHLLAGEVGVLVQEGVQTLQRAVHKAELALAVDGTVDRLLAALALGLDQRVLPQRPQQSRQVDRQRLVAVAVAHTWLAHHRTSHVHTVQLARGYGSGGRVRRGRG